MEDCGKTREQLKLLQASHHAASLELKAKDREKASIEDDLKAATQHLNSKQEELDVFAVGIW